ncbi:MAG: hypothetical protein AAGB22_07730, partial [Bacteroidota bacterium]
HNGELQRFNSAGMFELRAFQQDQPLALRQGREVYIEFPMTDTLPRLNFYHLDEASGKWELVQEISNSDRPRVEAPPEVLRQKQPKQLVRFARKRKVRKKKTLDPKRPYVYSMSGIDVAAVAVALERGLAAAQDPEQFLRHPYPGDATRFHARYRSLNYTGTLHRDSSASGYKPVKLVLRERGRKGAVLGLTADAVLYPELQLFREVDFTYRQQDGLPATEALLAADWRDARLEYYKGQRNFTLELKHDTGFVRVPVSPGNAWLFTGHMPLKYRQLYRNYDYALRLRNREFNRHVQRLKETWDKQENKRFQQAYRAAALWAENKEEVGLSPEKWRAYFRNHREAMAERFDSLARECAAAEDTLRWIRSGQRALENRLKNWDDRALARNTHIQLNWIGRAAKDDWEWMEVPVQDMLVQFDSNDRTNATLLAAGMDAGHTYPEMVRGLNVSDFGVYNCDQLYRLANTVNIQASYEDEQGRPIEGGHVLSMIDLDYNGAFSFDPTYFSCNPDGRNNLLLFTSDERVYLLEEADFAALNIATSGPQTFRMHNVTDRIKTTDDLRQALGLAMAVD